MSTTEIQGQPEQGFEGFQSALDRGKWERWMKGLHEYATATRKSGRTVHIVKLNMGSANAYREGGDDVAGAIQTIESAGWLLDHVDYVVCPSATASVLSVVTGYFLFRALPE